MRPTELPSDLDYWLDSHRITLLVNRYYFGETRFHSIFQPNAVLTRPNDSTTVGGMLVGEPPAFDTGFDGELGDR